MTFQESKWQELLPIHDLTMAEALKDRWTIWMAATIRMQTIQERRTEDGGSVLDEAARTNAQTA
jgi:hypothetical protein